MADKTDKGFTVVDRRIEAEDDKPEEPKSGAIPLGEKTAPCEQPAGACDREAVAEAREAYQDRAEADTPITFPSFLLSLHASALIHLGLIPEPVGGKKVLDLGLARQNIGLLEMLQDKTEGRRTPEENNLLENILYELRLAYVQIANQPDKGEKK